MPATSRILDSEIPRASVTGPNTRHRPLHSRIGVPVPSDCAGRLRPCATTTTNWGYLSKVHTHMSVFTNVNVAATAYYLSGMTGWGATYGGLPAVMLVSAPPAISINNVSVQNNAF